MKWVTRRRVHVNRAATAWLIRRFVDPEAEILFVEPDQVAEVQRRGGARGFDAPGAAYPHKDEKGRCSFEQIVNERRPLGHQSGFHGRGQGRPGDRREGGVPLRLAVRAFAKRAHERGITMSRTAVTAIFLAATMMGTALSAARSAAQGRTSALNTARIEELTGAKGALDEKEGVFKVSVPRSDLSVAAAGVRMTPPLGLTSWAAFEPAGAGQVMVMGDLVLLEDQVNPVMSVALDEGLEVTALHNHFFWDSPKVMFMHIGGTGEQDRLASAVGKVFANPRASRC
jgi:hypothetical protein